MDVATVELISRMLGCLSRRVSALESDPEGWAPDDREFNELRADLSKLILESKRKQGRC